ncbi:MAG: preprotein translocase subunit YajC [Candidatus Rokubacteria bacterium]|nr:preprotein translocase subunit YajC [Candidatus Rokubacteria bacterium]
MDLAYAADLAYASALPPGGAAGSVITQVLFFAAIFAIFYFLLIRPQQTQRRERERMLAALKKGDRVVTTGGLHGIILGLNEHSVILKIADQVKVEVDRTAISRVAVTELSKDA